MTTTDTASRPVGPVPQDALLAAAGVGKAYGQVVALRDINFEVYAGMVTCLLGDNGAGKSTLIKILSGVTKPDTGGLFFDGQRQTLNTPKESLNRGIATVFQDLAVVPVLPVYRNFCMGQEPVKGIWPFRVLDIKSAVETTRDELHAIGIDLEDVNRPIATLSGGQRQCVAIARAVHQGARVLILDEPTSALGVRQSSIVLKYILQTRDRGVGVVLVTHNPRHAYAVGNHFTVLKNGRVSGSWTKDELNLTELQSHMSGLDETEDTFH
jgi:simple sugar transport system ATP-binding protein